MNVKKHRLTLLLAAALSILAAPFLSAQTEDGDSGDSGWFWNKPVSEISFEGLRTVKKSVLTGVTDSFIGSPFTEDLYNDMLDRLYALEYFDDIQPFAKHDPRSPEKVLVVFQVTERPVISSILFKGNKKLSNSELRDAVSVKTSDIYAESKILIAERALRDLYIKKGYMNARISNRTEETDDGVKVTFVISEGANTVIASILFSGNTIVSERTLKSKISLKEVGFLKDGAFQKSSLEADRQAIVSYYQTRGYADARILDVLQETALNEKKGRNEMTITFVIQEGAQYTYGGLTITGNTIFPTEKLESFMKLKPGAVFNQTKFNEGLSGITNLYYENGYMTNQFIPKVSKDAERRTIAYELTVVERSRSHIENIIVKGNTKTKDYVILRELPFGSGDVFSRDKVMSGLRNLYNLQFFSSIVPEPVSGSEDGLVDLVITVEEQSTTSIQFGMTFSGVTDPDDFPISLFAKWQNSNLRGEGKTVSAGTTISTSEQSVDFSYSQPWLFDRPIQYSEALSFKHSDSSALMINWLPDGTADRDYYYHGLQVWGASLSTSFGRRWLPNFAILTVTGGLTDAVNDNVFDESLYTSVDSGVNTYANRLGLKNTISVAASLDNRDINYDPSKGWFVSQRLSWTGLIPAVEHEFYLKSDTKLEGYLKLLDIPFANGAWNFKVVLAGYTGLTAIFPLPDTLFSNSSKVYIDGMFNGRGWTDIYSTVRGRYMLSNRLELRIPLFQGVLGLAGFFDAAAIGKDSFDDLFSWQEGTDGVRRSPFYFSFGPGIRFLIPQFPLHLLFANCFRATDGGVEWDDTWKFVLSFNLTNR